MRNELHVRQIAFRSPCRVAVRCATLHYPTYVESKSIRYEIKDWQVIQHTQRASPNNDTKSKEKAKRGNMDVKQHENEKHERHTRQ